MFTADYANHLAIADFDSKLKSVVLEAIQNGKKEASMQIYHTDWYSNTIVEMLKERSFKVYNDNFYGIDKSYIRFYWE